MEHRERKADDNETCGEEKRNRQGSGLLEHYLEERLKQYCFNENLGLFLVFGSSFG